MWLPKRDFIESRIRCFFPMPPTPSKKLDQTSVGKERFKQQGQHKIETSVNDGWMVLRKELVTNYNSEREGDGDDEKGWGKMGVVSDGLSERSDGDGQFLPPLTNNFVLTVQPFASCFFFRLEKKELLINIIKNKKTNAPGIQFVFRFCHYIFLPEVRLQGKYVVFVFYYDALILGPRLLR